MNAPAEAAVASMANKSMYGGAGVAAAAGFTAHEFIAWAGLGVAVAGLVVNLIFKLDARRRAKREHAARMKRILGGYQTDTAVGELVEEE